MSGAEPVALSRHPALRVADVSGKGRGLVAGEEIGEDELLEVAPVIRMTFEDGAIKDSVLFNYPFAWDEPPYIEAIALGAISMCNHSRIPNARFEAEIGSQTIRLFARRRIRPGEEITIDYGIPLWFEEQA